MNNTENPIGVFDSGIGGLTVANAILRELPNESLVYFGDTAHLPYGDKSPETIKEYSGIITKFLLEKNVKVIVIACNSASATTFEYVQSLARPHQIKVVDVVNPVVNYISRNQFNKVGIIGTRATINSDIFPHKIHALSPNIEVANLATPLLAPMIEAGFVKGHISQTIVENYLGDPILENIQALVLACTHYPLIKKEIALFYEKINHPVEILATNEIVARYVKTILEEDNLVSQNPKHHHQFFVSDYTKSFEETTRLFYKEEVTLNYSPIFSLDNQ
ncbi:MAG TPA: glutamate racemase [Chitinophagales bacterium]|nr:glutamate racemase [Chitinophagales bacterium]